MTDKVDVSEANARFWSELCGSQLAKSIGVTDSSPSSLERFDTWYLDFYPYLSCHIPFESLRGKNVLEVGLGYGTVSQRLAEHGAYYKGLDIAAGPVAMANHRLRQSALPGEAIQGSILAPPFDSESFDTIIAIGCLHHTGDLEKAISQCHRLLRPGGSLIFMVYYAYSYRRWIQAPFDTLRYFMAEVKGGRGVASATASKHRAAYDKNSVGEGAPHTDWISMRSLAVLCNIFSGFHPSLENIDSGTPFQLWSRSKLLGTRIPRLMGLDLYVTAIK